MVFVVMMALGADGARAVDTCPNAALRTGSSAALPDCRAYELVSTDSNHSALFPSARASPDRDMMVYSTNDAPDQANSAQPVVNYVRARRDVVTGWSGVSLSPPLPTAVTSFGSTGFVGLSADLSSTIWDSDQPLNGATVPDGKNWFVGRPDGRYRLVTKVGNPFFGGLNSYPQSALVGGTPDFSHIYFQAYVRQLSTDPLGGFNTYAWSEDRGLRLIGILPGPSDTPAPNGATFAGASDDGKYVAFIADGRLYLRIDDVETVEVGASQRTVDPDPNPPFQPASVSVTADGSQVLFTSSSELTNDANTGESGGVASDAGRDLYSYDIATGMLKDLTVDTNPADLTAGANVQAVLAKTSDASHVYFKATGDLVDGAIPGHASLYVWHDGRVDFVVDAEGIGDLYMTPNGQHVAFSTTTSLTGYDNTDPITGAPHLEIFKATIGADIQCVSCRPDGTRPTGDNTVPSGSSLGNARMLSDDGRRVFFHSKDAILPQASNGLQHVFEYTNGTVSAISRVDGPSARLADASPSGDDVFFETYDGDLLPGPNGGDHALYDARVGGGFPASVSGRCAGVACQPAATPAPVLPVAASITFLGRSNALKTLDESTSNVSVSKVKTITGTTGSLRVKVPGKGRLTVSGSGLRIRRSSPTKAQTLTVRLVLTTKAARTLRKKRSLETRVKVAFSDGGGHTSAVTLSVTFKTASARQGR